MIYIYIDMIYIYISYTYHMSYYIHETLYIHTYYNMKTNDPPQSTSAVSQVLAHWLAPVRDLLHLVRE